MLLSFHTVTHNPFHQETELWDKLALEFPSHEEWSTVFAGTEKLPNWLMATFTRIVDGKTEDDEAIYLLEYIREVLNTGHWRDVSADWRVAYAAVRLHTVVRRLRRHEAPLQQSFLLDQLKLTDDALIMGCPILRQLGTRLATALHRLAWALNRPEEVASAAEEAAAPASLVELDRKLFQGEVIRVLPRFDRPSAEQFQAIVERGEPVIIANTIEHWPARTRWNCSYWRKVAGFRTVPVEIGSAYSDENWSQKLMTINEFIARFIEARERPVGYLAQHQLFLQIPELSLDVDTPDYCFVCLDAAKPMDVRVDSNIWFGPPGTVSPLHHDGAKLNLLAQVQGAKYVKLYQASQTPFLYPHEENMLSNTSRVDVVNADLRQFPQFRNARGFHGYISAGDLLFIPPNCWHYVESMSRSFSVNFWWEQ